jgi:hypothetical protein
VLTLSLETGPTRHKFAAYPQKLKGAMKRALRRVGTAVQKTMIDLSRERGVMKTIFGKKSAGARKSAITRSKLRDEQNTVVQPITIKGLAEIQEKGGRIKPHLIRPGRSGYLVIGGKPIRVPDGVQHPGATHPSIPFADRSAQRHSQRLREELDKEVTKLNRDDYA